MNILPGKSFARGISAVAVTGCVLSLSVHLLALAGASSKSLLKLALGLLVGVFPIFFLAVLAQERLLSKFTFRDRMIRMLNPKFARRVQRFIKSRAPKWLQGMFLALLVNALVQLLLFAFQAVSPDPPSQAVQLRLVSAYAAAFYAGAAMVLASYANTERTLAADEI